MAQHIWVDDYFRIPLNQVIIVLSGRLYQTRSGYPGKYVVNIQFNIMNLLYFIRNSVLSNTGEINAALGKNK